MFGEDEAVDNKLRQTTCTCISLTADVLQIGIVDFKKKVRHLEDW